MKKEEEGICYRYKETIEIRAWKERTLDRYKGDTGIYVYNVTVEKSEQEEHHRSTQDQRYIKLKTIYI